MSKSSRFLNGCPWRNFEATLRRVGLRPTRQRMVLAWLIFGKGDRHLTAEMLHEEVKLAKMPVSLATVYNTLRQFTEVGMLRQIAVNGSKAYFDTNVCDHPHFVFEDGGGIIDIAAGRVTVDGIPSTPPGCEIVRIDVVVRLRSRDRSPV